MPGPGDDFREAATRFDLGRYDEAIDIANRGLKRVPPDYYCYFILALDASRHRKGKQAEELLERARTGGVYPLDYYNFSAMVFENLGKLRHAEGSIAEALKIAPHQPAYLVRYASLLARKKQFETALQVLNSALEIDPTHQGSLRYKSKLLVILGRSSEAAAYSERLLKLNPSASDSHVSAGFLALRQNDSDGAFKAFREALRINPNSEEAREGVLEALRSRSRFYRLYFAFNLWLTTLPGWLVFVPLILCRAFLSVAPSAQLPLPAIICFLVAFVIVLFLVALRIFVKPVANIMLLFHPFGRLLLDNHRKAETGWFFGSLILLVLSVPAEFLTHRDGWFAVVLVSVLSCYLISMMSGVREKGPMRWAMFGFIATASFGFAAYTITPLV